MKVLVACEFSGRVRDAFAKLGHNAWSCDLLPTDSTYEAPNAFHYQGDVLDILYEDDWDLLIAHPPCTYLCNSGVHCLHKDPSRWDKMIEAAVFFRAMLCSGIPKIAVENPVMHKYALEHIGVKHTHTVQPYEFGDDASKRTCLWLSGLPKLRPTKYIEPQIINGKKRWSNQTPGGQNKIGPSKNRWKIRSLTYQGIADAMAEQWGSVKMHEQKTLFDKVSNI